jgi:hypothetical protein
LSIWEGVVRALLIAMVSAVVLLSQAVATKRTPSRYALGAYYSLLT